MAFTATEIRNIYENRAAAYDFTANAYYLLGFREMHYRRLAIRELDLRRGQTVIELGCGTGLNFPMIQNGIGSEGALIGVDLTGAMLEKARLRVKRNGWTNVELVHQPMEEFAFPRADRVISTFALTLVPSFDRIISRTRAALRRGGRLVVLDFREPEHVARALVKLAALLTSPFAVTLDLAERHPWESIERDFDVTRLLSLYFGFAYISTGIVTDSDEPTRAGENQISHVNDEAPRADRR